MPGGAGTPGGYDGGSGSSSGSSGGRNGGGGGEGGAAQRAAAQRAQAQLDADRLNAQRAAAAAVAEAEARETAREKAIQVAALTPKVKTAVEPVSRSPHKDTPLQVLEQVTLDKERPIEDLDQLADFTGFDTSPKIDIKDIKGEVTDPLLEALDDPKVDEGFKRYIRQTQQPIIPTSDRSGIFSKLDPKEMAKNQAKTMVRNKIMKELGLAGFNPLIGIGSWLMGKFAPGKKAALTEKLKSTIKPAFDPDSLLGTADWQGEKKRTTPREDRDGPKTTAETYLEEGQKMLGLNDAQQNYIRKMIASKSRQELMMIAGKGKIRIDSGEANQMEKDIFQMIKEYLV